MSRDLPVSIEPLHLAQEGAILAGYLPLAQMERIQDSLCDNHGSVYIHWSFRKDDQGYSVVEGKIQTQLSLQCQRCLQCMAYALEVPVALVVMMQSHENKEDDDLPIGYEALILTHTPVPLLTLVEDELILALPVVVMHGQCPSNEFVGLNHSPPEESTYNPFHVLKKLKQ